MLLNYHIGLLFCNDGWFSVSVNLRCIVVCVWCDVHITPNSHHYTNTIKTFWSPLKYKFALFFQMWTSLEGIFVTFRLLLACQIYAFTENKCTEILLDYHLCLSYVIKQHFGNPFFLYHQGRSICNSRRKHSALRNVRERDRHKTTWWSIIFYGRNLSTLWHTY